MQENTALHNAATYGHPECVKELLTAGADSTVRNKDGKAAEEVVGQHLGCREPVTPEHREAVLKAFREYQGKTKMWLGNWYKNIKCRAEDA
ncbi:ankyrin repeat and SOCS box protein 10-like [Branchiostoma floridae]|uniref:Ankyrin repeat and SOCS box protein 10-like n=1 Tax=Branchiostoma floridae TaxID=7739 RepID=A0A9J7MEK5_BRAFL|nr:ankyrin repeat and SOCS box protein 10-like [Branchiostoma floridae]